MSTSAASIKFYNGKTALPYRCVVSAVDDAFVVRCLKDYTESTRWLFEDMVVEQPFDGRFGSFSRKTYPNQRLVVEDQETYRSIAKALPQANRPKITLSASWRMLASLFAAAALIIAIVSFTYPYMLTTISQNIPDSWEEALGNYVIQSLASNGQLQTQKGQSALDALMMRLYAGTDTEQTFEIIVIDNPDEANALAAPGGKIVIYSGLLDDMQSPDELAGVIAHEMGHAIKRHPTTGAIHALAASFLFKVMSGGSGLADVLQHFTSLSYSRDQEREADEIAVEILRKANIGHQGLLQFFENIQAEDSDAYPAILSTHPSIASRIDYLQSQQGPDFSIPVLSSKQWQDLKAMCEG